MSTTAAIAKTIASVVRPAAQRAAVAPPKTTTSKTSFSAACWNVAFGETNSPQENGGRDRRAKVEDDLHRRAVAGLEAPVTERRERGELEAEADAEQKSLEDAPSGGGA